MSKALAWWHYALTVVAAFVVILVGTAPATTSVQASLQRVREDKVKTQIVRRSTQAGCPQMVNPGGRLDWTPTTDAGPFATNGSIVLPTLRVEAPIVRVKVSMKGDMVVPTNARDIAWFDQGPFPGKTNNIVLAGHIDYNGALGSFNGLQRLHPGDTVAVNMNGKTWAFEVKWSCLFDRNTNLADRIMGYTQMPSVTLISCGGVWDPSAGTHDKRIAVRGELIKAA